MQRTPYRTWLGWAEAAGYNVLYIPLRPDIASRYDATAALAWFEGVEGLAYGYHAMLWGWVDTLEENYPCLPPDYGRCLEWEFLEVRGRGDAGDEIVWGDGGTCVYRSPPHTLTRPYTLHPYTLTGGVCAPGQVHSPGGQAPLVRGLQPPRRDAGNGFVV